jgi:1,4-dihydroxy-2-naphthoate octaprenyltransferase
MDAGRILIYIKATRAKFLPAAVVPALLGAAAAVSDGADFNAGLFALTLGGLVCAHLGTNLANDYYDHLSGNDWFNTTPTPYSGGSRFIQMGVMSPRIYLGMALAFFAISTVIAVVLTVAVESDAIMLLWLLGVMIGYFFSGYPLKLGYRGIGEALVAAGFGPLIVLGAYIVQTGTPAWRPVFGSVPVALLIFLVLLINEFPDYEADRKAHKRTLVVLFGKRSAALVYMIGLIAAYATTGVLVIARVYPAWSLIAFLTLPAGIKAARAVRRHCEDIQALLPANRLTLILHVSTSLLIILGFAISWIF